MEDEKTSRQICSPLLTGRQVIYSDADAITDENVVDVLAKAMSIHGQNQNEIEYLWNYYKGRQPIIYRKKTFREDICNRIVENRANEIVSFKVGYLMGEPVQYINQGASEAGDGINRLNEYMYAENKAAEDKKLAEWFTICGTAFRMVLPSMSDEKEDAPFHLYTLDPRTTFVIYHSGLGNRPLMGVRFVQREDGVQIFSCYTDNRYYEIVNGVIDKAENRYYSGIPIIEYPANDARLGAFEIVLPLLDAINETASDRLDGVEQFIQAILMLKGVDIDAPTFASIRELGGLKVPPEGDAKYLTQELDQTQTQTLKDDLYQTVLTICGMPNRNGSKSTSDTGSAVIMRDGWSAAEARAKDSELMFVRSERIFLKLVLNMGDILRDMKLKLGDIGIRFTRRNYENIQEKSQVLTTMLANPKIARKLAFEYCGMFADPELAYTLSEEEYQATLKKQEEDLMEDDDGESEEDAGVPDEGSV